jgi:hypothetical protein
VVDAAVYSIAVELTNVGPNLIGAISYGTQDDTFADTRRWSQV